VNEWSSLREPNEVALVVVVRVDSGEVVSMAGDLPLTTDEAGEPGLSSPQPYSTPLATVGAGTSQPLVVVGGA
jgi:hypothetical protein